MKEEIASIHSSAAALFLVVNECGYRDAEVREGLLSVAEARVNECALRIQLANLRWLHALFMGQGGIDQAQACAPVAQLCFDKAQRAFHRCSGAGILSPLQSLQQQATCRTKVPRTAGVLGAFMQLQGGQHPVMVPRCPRPAISHPRSVREPWSGVALRRSASSPSVSLRSGQQPRAPQTMYRSTRRTAQ